MSAPLATLVLALAVLSMLTVMRVSPVVAGPVPDTVQMAVMRQAVADVPMVRVRGDFGTRSGSRPSLDSNGIRFAEMLEGPRSAMRTPATLAEPIPWQEITSMETEQPGSRGTGALIGGLLGLAVGYAVVLASAIGSLEDQQQRGMTTIGVSFAGGTVLGALIGHSGRRRTIYPVTASERRE